jgi:hypothetical protein
MPADFDDTDFMDGDFQSPKKPALTAVPTGAPGRPPTREEIESKVSETQQRLLDLKRMQEELERERAALEEARRRRSEYQTGREEMLQSLTRGVGLLEESEFNARRDAEQLAKTLTELRESLVKVQSVRDETWTQDNYSVELTRALTIIDNARMEWNAARLKWPLLNGRVASEAEAEPGGKPAVTPFDSVAFGRLCRLGLAFTWPLAAVALVALGVLMIVLFRR